MTSFSRPRATLAVEQLDDRCLPSTYTLTNLGTLGNSGFSTQAFDINESGQIVGYAVNPTNQAHAFLWQNGVMIDLGTLGGRHSQGNAINESGQVVGRSNIVPEWVAHGFLWDDGVLTDLTPFEGSTANGINDEGQVVGTYSHGRAFLWDDGAFTDLGTLGGPGAFGMAINNAGQAVGSSFTTMTAAIGPLQHAYLWQNGVMTGLGVLPGFQESGANAINSSGQVVGSSFTVDPESYNVTSGGFLYSNGSLIDLGLPGSRSSATDINDAGQIVGQMQGGAFLWDDGVLTNLNSVIPAGSGITLQVATAINNAGQIVGWGYDAQSRYTAFLLTPGAAPSPNVAGLSINDVSLNEGNSGTKVFTFTVSLSLASSTAVTVSFATANGTALAGDDYTARAGSITFAPGETTKTISIVVRGDRRREGTETFSINLSNATGALIQDAQGVGSIVNDDLW